MKKHLFDIQLYWDAIKQLKYLGLSGTLLLSLEALLIPIGYLVYARRTENLPGAYPQTVDAMGMHPLLVLCFCLIAPLMMLYLFQFLNKRAACDFYHALPNSRISLFLSFFSAVMTWVAAAAILSTLLSVAGFSLLRAYCSFNLLGVLIMLFNTLAASLYVCGVFAIGMCVTGTLFTNLTVSMLLLFMPRLLLAVFSSTLGDLLPVISSRHFIPPMDSQYNVVTNLLFGSIDGHMDLSFTFVFGGLYTLCLGALYTGLACWLFYKRKSETAGKSAPNRAVQTLYRLLIAMLICLIPCVMICSNLLGGEPLDGEQLFLYIVCYLAAVFVYGLYELFTTRKWRNVLRSLPALGILAAMNGLFIGGVAVAYYSTLSIRPEAEEIQAVRFIDNSADEYFSAKTATVRHTNSALLDIVAQRLQVTLDLTRQSSGSFYAAQEESTVMSQQVAIYLQGRTIYRNVLMTSKDLASIARALGENATFQQAYMRLPAHPIVSVDGLSGAQAAEVYAVMREEVASLSFTDWYGYLLSDRIHNPHISQASDTYRAPLATLTFSSSVGSRQYQAAIPLDDILPATCNRYMQLANQNADDDVLAGLRQGDWSQGDRLYIRLSGFGDGARRRTSERFYTSEMLHLLSAPLRELAEQLEGKRHAAPDILQPLYCLTLEREDGSTSTQYINADGPDIPDFLRQYGKS